MKQHNKKKTDNTYGSSSLSPTANFPCLSKYLKVLASAIQDVHICGLCLLEDSLQNEQVGTHPLKTLTHTRRKPDPLFLVLSELTYRQSVAEKDCICSFSFSKLAESCHLSYHQPRRSWGCLPMAMQQHQLLDSSSPTTTNPREKLILDLPRIKPVREAS